MPKKAKVSSNGHAPQNNGRITQNIRDDLMAMALNVASSRWGYLEAMMDPRRDIAQECGYADIDPHDPMEYRRLFDSDPIASRVIKLFPLETWGLPPEIYESEDPKARTPFEEAWLELGANLSGDNWHEDPESNVIWEIMRRADILSGIGHFGVILLGFNDTADLLEPVEGIDENGKSSIAVRKKSGAVANAKAVRKLLYMRVFDESQVQVVQLEQNPSCFRYGQPVYYNINFMDVENQSNGQAIMAIGTKRVHWTRIIHVVDNVLSSEQMGLPRCKPVLHRILDLRKLYGGSAEMFWKGAFPGLSIETQPQLQGDVEIDAEGMRQQMFDYMNSLQRYLTLTGMSAKTLAPSVSDPTAQINVQLEAISIELGIPMRIFKGSERGELASSQDAAAWFDRLKDRQRMVTTPRLIVPTVNRLIQVGCLPMPKRYVSRWPDLASLSEEEQARVGTLIVDVMTKYIAGGLEVLMTPMDFMMRILHFSQDEAEGILEAAIEAAETEQSLTLPPEPPMGPDGQPLPLGPDGQPLPPEAGGGLPMDEEGNPVDENGEPVDEETAAAMEELAGLQAQEAALGGKAVPGKTPPQLAPFAKQAQQTGRPASSKGPQVRPVGKKKPIPGFSKNQAVSNGSNPIKAIQAVGRRLAKCGLAMPGYGQIFIKENGSGEAWYVGGDGDERGFDRMVKSKLMAVEGIDEVEYADEGFPPKDEGWIQVYPKQRNWTSNQAVSNDGEWITVKGTHVMVGEGGEVSKGPKALKSALGGKGGSKSKKDPDKESKSKGFKDAKDEKAFEKASARYDKKLDKASGKDRVLERDEWEEEKDDTPPALKQMRAEIEATRKRLDALKEGKVKGSKGREKLTPAGLGHVVGSHIRSGVSKAAGMAKALPGLIGTKLLGKDDFEAIKGIPKDLKDRFRNLFKKGKFTSNQAIAMDPITLYALYELGLVYNAFCPTGPGGGQDNSCPPGKGGGESQGSGIAKEPKTAPPPGKDYNPNVEEKGEHGVTKAARVGVDAMSLPPPPSIGKLPNLNHMEREVETNFREAFENDPDGVADKFRDLVTLSTKEGDPKVFGTDDAKALTDVWSHEDQDQRAEYRASLNTPLHQTANAIAKRAFVRELDNLKEGDEILVTVGGCGAGKGYALKNVPEALAMKQSSKIVWDSAGDQNATENPWIQKEAEARGLKVNYVYVHADPYKAWADPNIGVVKRAQDPKDGRMVDAKVFADSYALGIKNHAAFYEAYKNNDNAKFTFLDNRGKPKLMDMIPEEGLSLDRHELSKFAVDAVHKSDAPARVVRGATIGQRIWAGESI